MRLTSPTLVLTLSFLPLSACTRATSAPHVNLASSTEALQEAFNRDSGKVRAIFLASPTCGECIHGASELERVWLDKDSSRNIAVYVVWSRQLGAEEKHVADAMTLVPDARARHYWDGEELVGKAFQPVLDLPAPAWDTWMLFDRTTTWRGDRAPTPAWWEHQLSVGPPERQLDPERFASHAEALKSVLGDHT
jgi:hypothetical protein